MKTRKVIVTWLALVAIIVYGIVYLSGCSASRANSKSNGGLPKQFEKVKQLATTGQLKEGVFSQAYGTEDRTQFISCIFSPGDGSVAIFYYNLKDLEHFGLEWTNARPSYIVHRPNIGWVQLEVEVNDIPGFLSLVDMMLGAIEDKSLSLTPLYGITI